MKTNSPISMTNPSLSSESNPARPPVEDGQLPAVRLPVGAATKAFLRALRAIELDYWQQSGGDYLRATARPLDVT